MTTPHSLSSAPTQLRNSSVDAASIAQMNNRKRKIDAVGIAAHTEARPKRPRDDGFLLNSRFDIPARIAYKPVSNANGRALLEALSFGDHRGPRSTFIVHENAQRNVPDSNMHITRDGKFPVGAAGCVDLSMHITRDGEFPVAAGGCADIYKGTLVGVSQTPIKVAIKAIKVYSAEDTHSKKTKRLRREVKVWMKLNHPNVLSLFGTTSGFGPFPAMVCPWLENGTLTSYLERCGADLKIVQLLNPICDAASGLQYLHWQSIVHGDLSGSNVLIDANGRARIADFGLSTILDEIGGSTFATSSTGKPRGTLRWAAPELLDLVDHGDAKTQHTGPTTQSDIYSFGSIMLQILSGKIPYHYYSRDMQIIAAISRGVTPTRPDNPHVTDRRWGFIQRCWSPFRVQNVVRRPSSEETVSFSTDEYYREFSISGPPSDDDAQSYHTAKSSDPSAHGPHRSPIHTSASPEAPCLHPERPILAPTQLPIVSPGSPHEQPPQHPLNLPTSDEAMGMLSMENIFSNGFWDSVLVPGYSDTMEGLSGGFVFGAGGSGLITPGWLPSPLPSGHNTPSRDLNTMDYTQQNLGSTLMQRKG